MAIGEIAGSSIYVQIPPVASDSLVYDIATKVKNNFPAGRKVYVELGDEPWNFGQSEIAYTFLMSNLFGSSNGYAWQVIRTGQIRTIFRTVFGSRANEVKAVINSQWDIPGSGWDFLSFAITAGVQIDAYAVAPYLTPDSGAASVNAWNNSATIAQMGDLWIHDQYYNNSNTLAAYNGNSSGAAGASHLGNIAHYNAAMGGNCYLIAYEGSYSTGTPGNNMATLSRDIPLHPNWRIIEQDLYALFQQTGYSDICIEDYDSYPGSPNNWPYYHSPQQPFGKGDGSDGKADNRLWFCTPGFIINYAPTITNTQDLNTVSVRGQALLEWMQPAKEKKRRLFVPYR